MNWEIQYGKLQFDQFALSKWDYTLPLSTDQAQWIALTRKWLALLPVERNYWFEIACSVGSASPGDSKLPSAEQITRIFTPHQTTQERKACVVPGGARAVWLRTCYAPELEDRYQAMSEGIAGVYVDADNMFDDAHLYDFGDKWHRFLERVPSLCDRWIDAERPALHDEECRPTPTDAEFELYDAATKEIGMVFLLDRQALLEELVTVMWLDSHGECVWWYRISVDDLQSFTGWLSATAGLGGMLELAGLEDEGGMMLVKGAKIDSFE